MSRRLRWLLGLATAWPLAYLTLFLPQLLEVMHFLAGRRSGGPAFPDTPALVFAFALHTVTMVVVAALVVAYVAHLSKNARIPEEQKLPWVLLLVLGSVLVMPVYFALHVARPDARATVEPRDRDRIE